MKRVILTDGSEIAGSEGSRRCSFDRHRQARASDPGDSWGRIDDRPPPPQIGPGVVWPVASQSGPGRAGPDLEHAAGLIPRSKRGERSPPMDQAIANRPQGGNCDRKAE
jgi:hypothetical protein